MAVGDVSVNPQTGQTFELQQVGNAREWIEIEGDKAAGAQEAAQLGTPGAFISGAARSAGPLLGFQEGQLEQAQARQSPTATLAGELSTALFPLGLGTAAGRGVKAGRAIDRVSAGVDAGVAKSAADRLIRRPSNLLGGQGTTLGSAARVVEAGVDAVPGLNLLGLGQRAFNRRVYNQGLAQAMGVSDEIAAGARGGITPPVRKAVRDKFAQDFGTIQRAIGENVDQTAIRATMDLANEMGFLGAKLNKVLSSTEKLSGKEVMDLRSDLLKVLRSNEAATVKNRAEILIDQIDDQIGRTLSETEQQLFTETRARWRLWNQARTGRGISADNQVNPISMDARLRGQRAFGDAFGAGEDIPGATQEVNDFLELMRSGSTIETGLQSSGTAERLIGVGALTAAGAAALNR